MLPSTKRETPAHAPVSHHDEIGIDGLGRPEQRIDDVTASGHVELDGDTVPLGFVDQFRPDALRPRTRTPSIACCQASEVTCPFSTAGCTTCTACSVAPAPLATASASPTAASARSEPSVPTTIAL